MRFLIFMSALIMAGASADARRFGESGPGNGTDYVKILFAEAQFETLRNLEGVGVTELAGLSLSPEVRHWLSSRISKLQPQLRRINLKFQAGPCGDAREKTASICFFREEEDFVLISIERNLLTTKAQAMAMLIHEAGHFLGEMDHLLLDRVGVELVGALEAPTLILADVEATEIVANVFQAKADCDSRTSESARALAARARTDLLAQCEKKRVRCADERIHTQSLGEVHFEDGKGFDMRVTCRVRAVYESP